MTLSDALSAAQSANSNYLTAAGLYTSLVAMGSPQPQTSNALAVAQADLTSLKATQANVDAAFAAL